MLGRAQVRMDAEFCVEVDTLSADAWDQVVCEFNDLTTDQIACFVDSHWNVGRLSHLLLRRNDVPVAGARLIVLTLPGIARGLAYVRFGPIWRRRDSKPDVTIYREAVKAIFEEYSVKRGHYLTLVPRPNPDFYSQEVAILSELGFKVRRPFEDSNRYFVELVASPDDQLKGFDQKWRYNLKQALRNEIDVRLCTTHDDIETFFSLYNSMVGRKGFVGGDPVHLLPDLTTKLPQPLRPHLVLASHHGRALVGAVVAILGDTAFYVFGASDETALPLKAGYALQWWITRWLSSQNVRLYDLGGEALSEGLRQFKKGFVGKNGSIVVMTGEYDCWRDYRGRIAADVIYLLRAGQRVYRELRYRA